MICQELSGLGIRAIFFSYSIIHMSRFTGISMINGGCIFLRRINSRAVVISATSWSGTVTQVERFSVNNTHFERENSSTKSDRGGEVWGCVTKLLRNVGVNSHAV